MRQNQRLRQYIVPEASLFHATEQRGLSLSFSSINEYSMKRRKKQVSSEQSFCFLK
jgi:hypothetical protein